MVLLTTFSSKQTFITRGQVGKGSWSISQCGAYDNKLGEHFKIMSRLRMVIRSLSLTEKLRINLLKLIFIQISQQLINWSLKSISGTYVTFHDQFLGASKSQILEVFHVRSVIHNALSEKKSTANRNWATTFSESWLQIKFKHADRRARIKAAGQPLWIN